jgi:hypothetical protein
MSIFFFQFDIMVSVTTMDEIFMKATNDEDDNKTENADIQEDLIMKLSNRIVLLNGFKLRKTQFLGAFIKNYLHAARNWKIILMQLLLPALMTILAAIQILSIPVIGMVLAVL